MSLKATKEGEYVLRGILQHASRTNGRIYPEEAMKKAMKLHLAIADPTQNFACKGSGTGFHTTEPADLFGDEYDVCEKCREIAAGRYPHLRGADTGKNSGIL